MKPTVSNSGCIPITEVIKASGSNYKLMKRAALHEEGICPYFTAGMCKNPRCVAAHLYGREKPEDYISKFCQKIQLGAEKVMKDGLVPYQHNKRR